MSKEEDYIAKRGFSDLFEPIIPDIRSWPIYRLGLIREKVVESVAKETRERLLAETHNLHDLRDMIAETYYQEQIRMKEVPWKVDPKDEKDFWRAVKKDLQRYSAPNMDPETAKAGYLSLLKRMVDRYAEEIAGDFKVTTFQMARRITTAGFTRLFNAATEGMIRGFFNPKKRLLSKIQIEGELESVRALARKGIVLLLPTHFSNLDSIVLGWAIDAVGLPAFTYGAGINLFGHPVLSYFMSRLGAFRVDRRKKHKVYLTCLKTYSQEVIERGCHTLFFPGGTRSRSGGIENRLKLGLLGTAMEAQRRLIRDHIESDGTAHRKIFVVPLVINYHFVLEAQNLIAQHLKGQGKEKSILLRDDFGSIWKNIAFIWKFLKSKSEMMISFGKPMDLFGNDVDQEGKSFDKLGREVNVREYYLSEGELRHDLQRDSEYTRMLGDKVLERYYEENVVFSSHLVAFSAFRYLRRHYPRLDLYELLAIPPEELEIPGPVFNREVDRNLEELRQLAENGKVKLASHLTTTTDKIIAHGIRNLGVYHPLRPLKIDKQGHITTQSLKLLFFYHNRLVGYGLEASE